MSVYEGTNLALLAFNFVVLWRTLHHLKAYTNETKRLADAAIQGLPRPCVVLLVDLDTSDRAVIEGVTASIADMRTLHFKNIGNGPALNLHYHAGSWPGAADAVTAEGPPLAPGEAFDSGHPRNALVDPCTVQVDYEGLGGVKFRSEITIEDRRWAKNFRFGQLAT